MARAHDESGSLRFSRRERALLIVTVLLSLFAHLGGYGIWEGIEFARKHGWWQKLAPKWVQAVEKKLSLRSQLPPPQEPDIFVDVSHADTDAPERAKYYSNKNSRAANEETANANVPKINGRQAEVPKTEDVARPVKAEEAQAEKSTKEEANKNQQFSQLQPSSSPQQPNPEENPTPQTPGETELLRPPKNSPSTQNSQTPPQQLQQRPRTLKQALAQHKQIPGQAMQQAGGVPRRALWSSLDVKSTQFGDYDSAIIEAVSQRWYDLLDSHHWTGDRPGKVTLHFRLKPDGTVIEVKTAENTVGDMWGYLCHEAIEESAPFGKWSPDMIRIFGNYRDITFTFYYY